jgi:hypothetical protein
VHSRLSRASTTTGGTAHAHLIAAVAIALVLTTAAYAFAAANTVNPSSAGDGSGAISGYTIGSQSYDLNNTDPTMVDAASFSVTPLAGNPAPALVKVQFNGAGTWYTATNPSGTTWSVDLSSASVSVTSLTSMRVIAGALTN